MSTEVITLEIDSVAVEAYKSASPEERQKLKVLLGLWLKEYAKADAFSLEEILDDLGRKARSRGLTPEILESILEEE